MIRDDRGTSLLEITVVLFILSLILPMIYGLIVSIQNNESTIQSRDNATAQAQVMGEALSRLVHAAATPVGMTTPFVSATANELVFYSSLGNAGGPTKLDIYTTPACTGCTTYNLAEKIVQPVLVNGLPTYSSSASVQIIGPGIVPPTPNPTSGCPSGPTSTPGIFQYNQVDGTCLPLTAGSLPSASFASVENLTISLTTVDLERAKLSPLSTITLQVSLPNVDYANS